ncbi:MAG: DMT family protein [Planctomycetota bacterium]
MVAFFRTSVLLALSNTVMTLAWYGHLRWFKAWPWILAALASWGIAFFEYMLQVPANRLGHQTMSIVQLKVLQEAISLAVFVPVSALVLKERVGWDFALSGVFLVLAVVFAFRGR